MIKFYDPIGKKNTQTNPANSSGLQRKGKNSKIFLMRLSFDEGIKIGKSQIILFHIKSSLTHLNMLH